MIPDNEQPIFEMNGKYFKEIQIKWADASPEERAKWTCYQQDHVKRMIEVDPITKQPKN